MNLGMHRSGTNRCKSGDPRWPRGQAISHGQAKTTVVSANETPKFSDYPAGSRSRIRFRH